MWLVFIRQQVMAQIPGREKRGEEMLFFLNFSRLTDFLVCKSTETESKTSLYRWTDHRSFFLPWNGVLAFLIRVMNNTSWFRTQQKIINLALFFVLVKFGEHYFDSF